jgi:hypothetical protein
MTLATILIFFALLASPPSGTPLQEPTQPSSSQPQAQPDTSQPEQPSQEPKPDQTPDRPVVQPQTPPAPQPTQPTPETAKPKPTPTKRHHHKKKTPTTADEGPKKVVVRNGSTTEPTAQIAPGGLSKQQASNQAQSTTQLLTNTNTNLQKLSARQLNASQQDTVKQIRTYMDQAKTATDAGDLQRAYNLAFKAHLLSDDLLKH